MTDPHALAEIARHMAASGIESIEVRSEAGRWRLVADPAEAPDAAGAEAEAPDTPPGAPAPPPPGPDAFATAAGIGRLRLAHPQRGAPDLAPGDAVRRGQVLAFLRAGPLLQPVLAPCDGVLGAPLAAEDSLLGFGDRVFAIRAVDPEVPVR